MGLLGAEKQQLRWKNANPRTAVQDLKFIFQMVHTRKTDAQTTHNDQKL